MSTRYDIPGANAQDEGTFLGLGNVFNFTGAGVTASIGADGVVTVAIPGGGAGGTPALPFTSVQFNNAGAFGGSSNFTWDGTGLTVTNGAALNSYLTPAVLTLNTNNSGTISVKNGAADAALNLDILDLQINGASGLLGQVLTSGGAGASPTWSAIPAASGWVDGGTTVYLATTTDVVSVGSNTPVTNRKLSVYNTGTNLGASIVTLASTDNVIETFVGGEANLRWSVDGTGATKWGAGGGSALDTRLYRSAAATLTLDNGAAGAANLVPGADSVGAFGTSNLRWLDFIANTHRVFPSAGAVNASTSLGSGFLKLGAGGATALDTAITRTAAATLTVDNNAGGSATLIVKGTTTTQQRIHGQVSKVFADSPYTAAATDEMVFWNCTGGNCVENIPTPVGAGGRTLIVKRTDTTANTLTLTPAAGQVEGGASYVMGGGATRASVTLMSDGSNWWVI